MNTPQIYFDHEKLVAYQRSIQFVVLLARTPTIPEPRYAALVARAEALGFDLSRLISAPPHTAAELPTLP